MPVHHLLEQILDEYIVAAGLQSGQPLFQSVNSAGTAVTGRALNRYNAWAAIRKRAMAAGFLTPVGCHTWRATGITVYLENDGRLEQRDDAALTLLVSEHVNPYVRFDLDMNARLALL